VLANNLSTLKPIELQPNTIECIAITHTTPFLFFFFSSRRRHTRFSRDWSSDVCSSDLIQRLPLPGVLAAEMPVHPGNGRRMEARSEERRVGKGCRARWSPYH